MNLNFLTKIFTISLSKYNKCLNVINFRVYKTRKGKKHKNHFNLKVKMKKLQIHVNCSIIQYNWLRKANQLLNQNQTLTETRFKPKPDLNRNQT